MNIYFYYTSDKSTGALGAPGAQNHEYEYEHFLYIWKSEIWIFTFKKHLEEAPEPREPREPREPWEPREPREPQTMNCNFAEIFWEYIYNRVMIWRKAIFAEYIFEDILRFEIFWEYIYKQHFQLWCSELITCQVGQNLLQVWQQISFSCVQLLQILLFKQLSIWEACWHFYSWGGSPSEEPKF